MATKTKTITDAVKLEFLAQTIAAAVLDKLYIPFERRLVDLDVGSVEAILKSSEATDFILAVPKSLNSENEFDGVTVPKGKTYKVYVPSNPPELRTENWRRVLLDGIKHQSAHVFAAVRTELASQTTGQEFYLAGLRLFLYYANTEGEIHDLVVKKFGLKSKERLVYKYEGDLIVPVVTSTGPVLLNKSGKAMTNFQKSRVVELLTEEWTYLDKDGDDLLALNLCESFAIKGEDNVENHRKLESSHFTAALREIVPLKKATAPGSDRGPKTSQKAEVVEKNFASERSSSKTEEKKPAVRPAVGTLKYAAVKAGETEFDDEKKRRAADLITKLVAKNLAYYNDPEKRKNKTNMKLLLAIAAGLASSELAKEKLKHEKKGKTKNVLNIITLRLLFQENDNNSIVQTVVKGDPLFPNRLVHLALDTKSQLVQEAWFNTNEAEAFKSQGIKVNANLTSGNKDLESWLQETVMPGFWAIFAPSLVADFKIGSETAEDTEDVEVPERIVAAKKSFGGSKEKKSVVRKFGTTVGATQEIGFSPAWAAALPILEGDEAALVNGNMKDLRDQSMSVAQEVLRMDSGDLHRLELIKKNVAALFQVDDRSTIETIRKNLVPIVDVNIAASEKPFQLRSASTTKVIQTPQKGLGTSQYEEEAAE
uniref:Uncharacterized protein n=1 Tax=viral metagenome TaxID=1070528 RepID=A0A6C0CF60_9ZZZZ